MSISVSESLPAGTLSNTAWRRAGVKYSNNECFVDIVETVDCILDRNGTLVVAEIRVCLSIRVRADCILSVHPRIVFSVPLPGYHSCKVPFVRHA